VSTLILPRHVNPPMTERLTRSKYFVIVNLPTVFHKQFVGKLILIYPFIRINHTFANEFKNSSQMVITRSQFVISSPLHPHVLQARTVITHSHISVCPQFQFAGNNHAYSNKYCNFRLHVFLS
jgi:hypothetical protein